MKTLHFFKWLFLPVWLFVMVPAVLASETSFAKEPFSKQGFDALQEKGVPVLIDVYASWCPTCERQQWLLDAYFKANPNSKVKVLVVDFDKDKQWVKHFKAPRQSTLALYQNNQRTWFSVAETRKRYIFDALQSVE